MLKPPPLATRAKTYRKLWDRAKLLKVSQIDYAIDRIENNELRYRQIEMQIGVPAIVVGLIHSLEADCNFNCHLHNGDPLTLRTTNEPKCRPELGNPPFTWESSAIDALTIKNLPAWRNWTIEGILYQLESYNGWGYYPTPIYSPYLWSFTSHYTKGKYVSDGKYDPEAVSNQAGAAAILLRMYQRGMLVDAPLWL